jgi:hypothetical protein
MTATHPRPATWTDDPEFAATFELDPMMPGRHNVRFAGYGNHVWTVLDALRRLADGRDLTTASPADVAVAAQRWGVPESVVRIAMRYYDHHRALYDAYFLLEEEADRADFA